MELQEKANKKLLSAPYVVEPSSLHTQTFLLLHGLGSNGEKFGKELLETGITSGGKSLLQEYPGAKFIFPTSKRRRSSAFGRAMLTQWFDIASLDDPSLRSHTQIQGLEESYKEIMEILNEEIQIIGSKNIVFGGLSQGCAMSLICLLTLGFSLGAFVGMSGWLPFQHEFEDIMQGGNERDGEDDDNPFGSDDESEDDHNTRDPVTNVIRCAQELVSLEDVENASIDKSSIGTPIFIGHGDKDEKIKPALGKNICDVLQKIGFAVSWKSYNEGHWYKIPEEIDDIVEFLKEIIN